MMIDTEHLAGAGDLARRYHVAPPTLRAWYQKPTFPKPLMVLSCGSIWDRREVDKWVYDRDKAMGHVVAPVHRRFVARKAADHRNCTVSKKGMLRWVIFDRRRDQEVPKLRFTSSIAARAAATRAEFIYRNPDTPVIALYPPTVEATLREAALTVV